MDSVVDKVLRFKASNDILRKSRASTTIGGFDNIDTTNRFIYYEQMSLMSPHIFVPIHKTALTICKHYRFESPNGNEERVKEFTAWGRRINLDSRLRTLVRLLCRNGTYVALWDKTKKDPKFMSFEPLLMSKTTLLPKGYNPDSPPAEGDIILTTPVSLFIVNEGDEDKKKVFKYKPEDVVYIALFPFDYEQKDIKGRNTYGLYGISLLESVMDIFNKYMDVVEGYAKFIKKYGQGRYHINYVALEDALAEGDTDGVIAALEKLKGVHQDIQENEDIISAGCEIKTIDMSGSLTVDGFKRSLENDIEVGLMQSPITMGKGEGSTYASGYIAESERLLTLEGLQREIVNLINEQIIRPRALALGAAEDTWQDEIQIIMDEISELNIPLTELIEAYVQDLLTVDEVREFIDLKPIESEIDNGVNPVKMQAEQAKLQMEMQEKNAKIQAESVKQQGRQPVGGKSTTQMNMEKSQQLRESKTRSLKV